MIWIQILNKINTRVLKNAGSYSTISNYDQTKDPFEK